MVVVAVPVTRFSVAPPALARLKTTLLPAPTEKLCQLMTAFWLAWVMVVAVLVALMVALPAAMLPPLGSVPACAAATLSTAHTRALLPSNARRKFRAIDP